ncbi:MAG: DNA polymerase III subunit epsilon [Proteobacteria bacterium]|nr:DNA polymerase III subunit epsilon [Pseudomonadota bacterium]
MNESALNEVLQHPDYMVLRRLPEKFEKRSYSTFRRFSAIIIDLETMGLDPRSHAIIELGLLKFSFTNEEGIIEVLDTYNSLNDPNMPIPEKITKITGITNEDVAGKKIDWDLISILLKDCNLVVCHNSAFDRNFLEIQTPDHIQELFKKIPFACTIKDIDWFERGFESSKLDYLNWKLGFFYDGHRALTDCWATLNLLLHETGAFDELKKNAKKIEILLCAVYAPYEKKELLKERKYKWSDGTENLPKCWWVFVSIDDIEDEILFLEETIYCRKGAASNLPRSKTKITAHTRYSFRSENIN